MKKGLVVSLFLALCALPAWGAVECYGTFECMGVVATPPAGYTAAQLSAVRVYLSEGATWKRVQDAVQVASEERFASSVFGLSPGRSYSFKVEFYDLVPALVLETANQPFDSHSAVLARAGRSFQPADVPDHNNYVPSR